MAEDGASNAQNFMRIAPNLTDDPLHACRRHIYDIVFYLVYLSLCFPLL